MFFGKKTIRVLLIMLYIPTGVFSTVAQMQRHPGPAAGCPICYAYRLAAAKKEKQLNRELTKVEENSIIKETENRMLPELSRNRLREIEELKSVTRSPSELSTLTSEETQLRKQLKKIETGRKPKSLGTQKILNLYDNNQSSRAYRY